MRGDPYTGRPVDVKDLKSYLAWALEHIENARLVAAELHQPTGVLINIRLAKERLERAFKEIKEGDA